MERFWAKVQKTDTCWLWTGSTATKGHGHFRVDGRLVGAHRFSWELHRGPIPEGQSVLHNCPGGDNPRCVNPAHLWLGSKAENNTDRSRKGRDNPTKGTEHYSTSFTDDAVRLIRSRYAAGEATQRALAAEHSCSKHAIYCIIHRKTWKHI